MQRSREDAQYIAMLNAQIQQMDAKYQALIADYQVLVARLASVRDAAEQRAMRDASEIAGLRWELANQHDDEEDE